MSRLFRQEYAAQVGELLVPLLVGVLPLFSDRHTAFLANEVPGIHIPDSIQDHIRRAGADAPEEGVRLAKGLVESLLGTAQGVYLMPAFHRFDLAAEVIDFVKSLTPASKAP